MVRERAERNGGSASTPMPSSLNVAELRQLISLMEHSDIEEITIERESDGLHLTLRKPAPVVLDPATVMLVDEPDEQSTADADVEAGVAKDAPALDVRSTLVGFYRAVAKRGSRSLAAGDTVKEGQIIGAVEALNVLNEIESPTAGKVREILVGDGQPVEYGQVLMMVEPIEA
ncbi:MAG TPA: biotin/lipoyl-containing protein [Ktedonobacterales bacterium]|nr:biotin/lipoyl-containing protein [Ktedonobacterales bacterium]